MSNKGTIIEREKQRATSKAADRDSFIARNYGLWVMVAFVAYPLASVLSAFTEGSNVYFRISATGAPWILVVLVVFIVVVLIEVLSYTLGKGAIDDMQAGVFSGDGADKGMFAVKVIGFLAIMGFSVFLSINGAPLLNEKLRKSYAPAEASFMNVDSINAAYNLAIAPHAENIKHMQATKWKGSITRDANRSIMASQKLIAQIEDRRTAELSAATDRNTVIRGEWEDETSTNSSYAMGFAGMGEIIKLFCLIFIGIYYQGLSKEAAVFGGSDGPYRTGRDGGQQGNGQSRYFQIPNNSPGNNSSPGSYPTSVQPIGFFQRGTVEPDISRQPAPSVANVSYTPVHEEMEGDYPIDLLKELRFYADAKRQYDCYEANTRVATETKAKRQEVFRKRMAHSLTNMNDMGYQPRLVNRTWELIPLN